MEASTRHGLGDPRIPWLVLLEIGSPTPALSATTLLEGVARLYEQARWPDPTVDAVVHGERRELLGRLAAESQGPVRVGVHDHGLVIAARHDCLDGLGMLSAAGILTGSELRSSARGIAAGRAGSGTTSALLRRAWEVLAQPPARVAAARSTDDAGDSFASRSIDVVARTADLVHAGAQAVAAWNRGHQLPARRVSIAVGVSTVGGDATELVDRSAFLRLTDVETMSLEAVRHELAHAPVQPNSVPGTARAVAGTLLRWAAPRLGSTLLVSHLGEITSVVAEPDSPPAFYPVSGGGSGLSLGATTVAGRTTLTLRSRAARHGDHDLERLLDLVLDALG